jgi:ribosomal protein S18 acetylase RimI-like enzyme
MKVEYIDEVTNELEKTIEIGHEQYEEEHGISAHCKKFSVALRDKNQNIIGGLIGYTVYEEIYIDDLWVDKAMRGQGYGKQLIEIVERKFANQGYDNINLVTNEFQSPLFYKKLGFEIEFMRPSSTTPKLNKYYLIKRLKK